MKKLLFPVAFFAAICQTPSVQASFIVTSGPFYSTKEAEADRVERAELERVETIYRYLTNLEQSETLEDLCSYYDVYSFERLKKKLVKKETEDRVAIKEHEIRDFNLRQVNH
jgi:hypothetical protein